MGYAQDVACGCENSSAIEQAESHETGCDSKVSCLCVCQQPVVQFSVVFEEGPVVSNHQVERLPVEDEFPADALSIGIDYPPQIA